MDWGTLGLCGEINVGAQRMFRVTIGLEPEVL